MNHKDIIEGNLLIAKFMGNEPYKDERYGTLWSNPASDGLKGKNSFSLKYNISWDLLMPVAEKVYLKLNTWINKETIELEKSKIDDYALRDKLCHIKERMEWTFGHFSINKLWEIIVEFIELQNKQK